MNFTVKEIAEIIGGVVLCGDENTRITNVKFDSREVGEGTLFVPIRGAKVDPHDFIEDCFKKGAAAALTERDTVKYTDKPYIRVENCLSALQKLSAYYRQSMKAKLIGVTGSVGKTSTKEMIAAALSKGFDVMKTQGNRNSQIGLPITMFEISPYNDIAVIEMGMSEFGEMDRLCDIAKPDIAVMTNIGKAHIENLGTQENILEEKFKITKNFDENGVLFLNGNDPLLMTLYNKQPFKTLSFGLTPDCDCYAENIRTDGFDTVFTCRFGDVKTELKIPALGQHSVMNAAAAFAAGIYLGLDVHTIQQGLLTYKNAPMRQQIHKLSDFVLIDDSYNSSPEAAKVSTDVLKSIAKGKTIAVLADMLELGDEAEIEHYNVGKHLASRGIDVLIAIGQLSENTARGARENGCGCVVHFNDNDSAYEYLSGIIERNCTVLVKGSRGMHTDEICKKMKAE